MLGAAGEGKTRLVEEFLASVGGSSQRGERPLPTVRRGDHVLACGRSRSRRPLGVQAFDAPEDVVARVDRAWSPATSTRARSTLRLGEILGVGESVGAAEETPWAIRRFLETLAAERPLVALWEDIHWAEPAFLDVVDHIVDWSRDAPIMLVCTARPGVPRHPIGLGRRQAERHNAPAPAPRREGLGRTDREPARRCGTRPEASGRLTEAAGGNPLFVEQMLSMMIDDGMLVREDGAWIPGERSQLGRGPTLGRGAPRRPSRTPDR